VIALNRLLFGPPEKCVHCWHLENRRDCRNTSGHNQSFQCCKCGDEVVR